MSAEEKFNCIFCKELFDDKETLQIHFRKHGDRNMHYNINKKRNKKGNKVDDESQDDEEKSTACDMVKCDVCPEVFPTISKAISHKRRSHPQDDSKYFCPWCGKLFTIKTLFDKHLADHNTSKSPEETFLCDCCEIPFYTVSAMLYHNKFFHRQETELPAIGHSKKQSFINKELVPLYYCPFCGEQYINKVNLHKHMRETHQDEDQTPDELLRCPLCDAIFYLIDGYEMHLNYHTQNDIYSGKENSKKDGLTEYNLETVPPIWEQVENNEPVDSGDAIDVGKFLQFAMDTSADDDIKDDEDKDDPGHTISNSPEYYTKHHKKRKKHKKSKKAISLNEFLNMNSDVFGEDIDIQGVEEVPTQMVTGQLQVKKALPQPLIKPGTKIVPSSIEKLKKQGITIKMKQSNTNIPILPGTKIGDCDRIPIGNANKLGNSATNSQIKQPACLPGPTIDSTNSLLSKLINQSNSQIKIVNKPKSEKPLSNEPLKGQANLSKSINEQVSFKSSKVSSPTVAQCAIGEEFESDNDEEKMDKMTDEDSDSEPISKAESIDLKQNIMSTEKSLKNIGQAITIKQTKISDISDNTDKADCEKEPVKKEIQPTNKLITYGDEYLSDQEIDDKNEEDTAEHKFIKEKNSNNISTNQFKNMSKELTIKSLSQTKTDASKIKENLNEANVEVPMKLAIPVIKSVQTGNTELKRFKTFSSEITVKPVDQAIDLVENSSEPEDFEDSEDESKTQSSKVFPVADKNENCESVAKLRQLNNQITVKPMKQPNSEALSERKEIYHNQASTKMKSIVKVHGMNSNIAFKSMNQVINSKKQIIVNQVNKSKCDFPENTSDLENFSDDDIHDDFIKSFAAHKANNLNSTNRVTNDTQTSVKITEVSNSPDHISEPEVDEDNQETKYEVEYVDTDDEIESVHKLKNMNKELTIKTLSHPMAKASKNITEDMEEDADSMDDDDMHNQPMTLNVYNRNMTGRGGIANMHQLNKVVRKDMTMRQVNQVKINKPSTSFNKEITIKSLSQPNVNLPKNISVCDNTDEDMEEADDIQDEDMTSNLYDNRNMNRGGNMHSQQFHRQVNKQMSMKQMNQQIKPGTNFNNEITIKSLNQPKTNLLNNITESDPEDDMEDPDDIDDEEIATDMYDNRKLAASTCNTNMQQYNKVVNKQMSMKHVNLINKAGSSFEKYESMQKVFTGKSTNSVISNYQGNPAAIQARITGTGVTIKPLRETKVPQDPSISSGNSERKIRPIPVTNQNKNFTTQSKLVSSHETKAIAINDPKTNLPNKIKNFNKDLLVKSSNQQKSMNAVTTQAKTVNQETTTKTVETKTITIVTKTIKEEVTVRTVNQSQTLNQQIASQSDNQFRTPAKEICQMPARNINSPQMKQTVTSRIVNAQSKMQQQTSPKGFSPRPPINQSTPIRVNSVNNVKRPMPPPKSMPQTSNRQPQFHNQAVKLSPIAVKQAPRIDRTAAEAHSQLESRVCFKKPYIPAVSMLNESDEESSESSFNMSEEFRSSSSSMTSMKTGVISSEMKSKLTRSQQINRMNSSSEMRIAKASSVRQSSEVSNVNTSKRTLDAIEKLRKQGLLVKKPRLEDSSDMNSDDEYPEDESPYLTVNSGG